MIPLRLFLITIALATRLAAQSTGELERFIAAGQLDRARESLVSALDSAGNPTARGGLLDRVWQPLRRAGGSAHLLAALDRTLERHPDDTILLYYRGSLRADLKLHAGSRADFERVVAADPAQRTWLARLAGQAFRHHEAAEQSRDLDDPQWQAFHAVQGRLASSLDVAIWRQGIVLALLLAAAFGGIVVAGRSLRRE